MDARRRLIGFAICFVVGVLVSFVVVASHAVLSLSVRDSEIDVRVVFGSALGFAIICDAVRARRRPRVPRASLR
jgi:uncharacterized membrane protein